MEFRDYLQILRNRWRTIVVFTALGGLLALGASMLMTPIYQANTLLYIASNETSNVLEAYAAGLVSSSRVDSYQRLANTELVAARAIQAGKLNLTTAELQSKITTTVAPRTVIISLAVSDPDAEKARDLTNGVADAFARTVAEFEKSAGGAFPGAHLEVIEKAHTPSSPISPRTLNNTGYGLLGGLAVGLLVAVFRDRLDNRVKDVQTLQAVSNLPVIGVLPYDAELAKTPTIDFSVSRSLSSEAFRSLRTNLQFVAVDDPPRVMVVTSATPEEGKSTCAINLAAALAEAGHSVVVVEGDLRRPRISKYLGVVSTVGLTTVIAGTADVGDILQRTTHPRMHAIASGPIPPNPSELLGSASFKSVIERLRQVYDYVIVDAPPTLPVSDAAVIGTVVDGVIFVARHGKAKREQVTRALDAIRAVGADVLGTVLTVVPQSKGSPYRGGDYYYYYSESPEKPSREADASTSRRASSRS